MHHSLTASAEKKNRQKKNTQIDNAKYLNLVMPMYNLIEYSYNYLKTSESLWQYYKNEPNASITDSE